MLRNKILAISLIIIGCALNLKAGEDNTSLFDRHPYLCTAGIITAGACVGYALAHLTSPRILVPSQECPFVPSPFAATFEQYQIALLKQQAFNIETSIYEWRRSIAASRKKAWGVAGAVAFTAGLGVQFAYKHPAYIKQKMTQLILSSEESQ